MGPGDGGSAAACELGFVHVFIGGGGIYIDEAVGLVRYFDAPHWGAMLGSAWRYFRVKPWLPPLSALAFFVVIFGFNLFGHGLQRFLDERRFHPSGCSILRRFGVIRLVLVGMRGVLAGSSEEARYEDLARQFHLERARDDIAYLTWPEEDGHRAELGEGVWAASYIGHKFREIGLTGLPKGGYLHSYVSIQGKATARFVLEVRTARGEEPRILDEGTSFDPEDAFQATYESEAELWVVANSGASGVTTISPCEAVLLLIDPREEVPGSWARAFPFAGVLRVVSEEELARNDIAPTFTGILHPLAISPLSTPPRVPRLLIGEAAADALLHRAGLELEALRAAEAKGGRIVIPTDLRVHLRAGLEYTEVPARNVIGYLPGADVTTAGEGILVVAPDGVPSSEGGASHVWADENASGVAVMLEIARLRKDLAFDPKRTVVFAAFDMDGWWRPFHESPPDPNPIPGYNGRWL